MATMYLLLLALTLGVANAGNLFFAVQQQEQQPPSDGFLCPNQISKCPHTATCCQLSSGEWGCCPFASATCCADNVHCCPNGYSCNNEKQQCMRPINNDTIPWAKKTEAAAAADVSLSTEKAVNPGASLTCPDRTSTCPGASSCCRTLTGAYRCCPYPNNVCCSNGYSCCPRCTVCDQLNNKCLSAFETEKWETVSESVPATLLHPETTEAASKLPAKVASAVEKVTLDPLMVVWCNATHYCSDGQTCCWQPSNQWGCCPYNRATCCYGSNYCCPLGKRCTNPAGRCY